MIPGVTSTAYASCLPVSNACFGNALISQSSGKSLPVTTQVVSPSFFETFGVPLRQGRLLEAQDAISAPHRVVLSDLAVKHLGLSAPLGAKVELGGYSQNLEVVGVVGDVKYESLTAPVTPAAYVSIRQFAAPYGYLAARSSLGLGRLVAPMRAAAKQDAGAQPQGLITMEDIFSDDVSEMRFLATLLTGFGTTFSDPRCVGRLRGGLVRRCTTYPRVWTPDSENGQAIRWDQAFLRSRPLMDTLTYLD